MSKLEKLKELQLRAEELSNLALVGDQFRFIEENFHELDLILNARLDSFIGLQECFQRAYMEIENVQDEISEQIRNMRDRISSNIKEEE